MNKDTDFSRDVIALFGLPFDRITLDATEQRLLQSITSGRKLLLSTPNLNFVALSQRDEAFRQSVLVSDLSVVDGAGVMLLARLMGAGLPERVAGATLFERLLTTAPRQLRVFLLGGTREAATAAAANIRKRTHDDAVVGHLSPGFGDAEPVTSPADLTDLRARHPNLVLVALGARKGQRWILDNWDALPSCVVSHLGATLNFVAGTLARAPRILQRAGLEWAWRIKEEPHLWRRYGRDALDSMRLLALHWPRHFITEPLRLRPGASRLPPQARLQYSSEGQMLLQLRGRWRPEHADLLVPTLRAAAACQSDLLLYLSKGTRLAAPILGKLLLLAGHQIATQRRFKVQADERALLARVNRLGLRDQPAAAHAPLPQWPALAPEPRR